MNWVLVSENTACYFRFAWSDCAAIYSTKHGQESLLKTMKPTFLKQIHSNIIVNIDSGHEQPGDGLVSAANTCLGIKIADCLPVYLLSDNKICVLHCGWRGIIGGITTKAKEMFKPFSYVLGASIGPCCYEVKQDVVALFNKDHARAIIVRDDKYYLDLKSAVIKDLGHERLLGNLDLCTKCNPQHFYSNRRGDRQRNYALVTRTRPGD